MDFGDSASADRHRMVQVGDQPEDGYWLVYHPLDLGPYLDPSKVYCFPAQSRESAHDFAAEHGWKVVLVPWVMTIKEAIERWEAGS